MVELGNFALFLSLPVVLYAAIMPIIGVIAGKRRYIKSARYAVYANGIITTTAAIALITAFLTNRFDIAYVYEYSSSALEPIYKIAALYAGQAGSLLFWAWMLSLYMVVVIYQNRNRNQNLMPYVMFIAMTVLFFFIFILTVAPTLFYLGKNVKSIFFIISIILLATSVFTLLMAGALKFIKYFNSKFFKEYVLIGILISVIFYMLFMGLSAKKPTESNPFEPFAHKFSQLQKQVETAGYDAPPEGRGLNPMLRNYGMVIHPPTLYMGYVGFTIPFAFAIAALLTGSLGSAWIASTRKWTIFAWFFLSVGIVLGAQWAYMELGWGGYWAWDPVENASFLPWLTGTAFLHSVMIQEKKNMLKVWNMILIILTFSLSLFGTYLTRSGILSSVHTFGESSLGKFFLSIVLLSLMFSLILLVNRLDQLKSENELDSLLSREASFLMNNLLLVGAAFAVLWGTLFPIISEAITGKKPTVGPPFYNQIMVPIAIALFFTTAICPLIAWRRASHKNLVKNFAKPFSISAVIGIILALLIGVSITRQTGLLAALIIIIVLTGVSLVNKKLLFPVSALAITSTAIYFALSTGHYIRFIIPGFLVAALVGSAFIVTKNKESRFGLGLAIGSISGLALLIASVKVNNPWALTTLFLLAFIATTIAMEFYRGTRIRYSHAKERAGSKSFEAYDIIRAIKAFATLIWKNKRRYGGYIIHTGIVLMFIGITASSTWKVSKEATLRQGESMDIKDYRLYYKDFYSASVGEKDNPTKIIYAAKVDVYKKLKNNKFMFLGEMEPQKNYHPNKMQSEEENQPTSEVDLLWDLKEDLYLILNGYEMDKKIASFKVFVNPMMAWMWIGGIVICFGTIIIMWPDVSEKRRLAARYGWSH